jgi:hypothetical protein
MHRNNNFSSFVSALSDVAKTKSALKGRLNSMNHPQILSRTMDVDGVSDWPQVNVHKCDNTNPALRARLNLMNPQPCPYSRPIVLDDANNQFPGTRPHPQY